MFKNITSYISSSIYIPNFEIYIFPLKFSFYIVNMLFIALYFPNRFGVTGKINI